MNLPYLRTVKRKTEKMVVTFRGVNYGEDIQEGQLEDSRNLTSERFPVLSPRVGRSTEGEYENATAVYYKGKRFVVDGTSLLYGDNEIATVSAGKKQFATVNSKVVVFPDKIVFDMEAGEVRSLGVEYTAQANALEIVNNNAIAVHLGAYYSTVISSGNVGGNDRNNLKIAERQRPFTEQIASVSVNKDTGVIAFGTKSTCPPAESIRTGMLFVSASLGADGVKTWGKVTKKYNEPVTPVGPGGTSSDEESHYGFDYDIYGVKGADYEAFSGFEAIGFQKGDTIEIEGLETYSAYNGSYTIRDFGTYKTSDGTSLPTLVFDNDVFSANGKESGTATFRRKVPNLTVVCESNNRLWGAEGNTIFASSLGDPTNFYTYDGLDTDSYAVAVASDGAFTGCIGFGNSVLFFKEDRMYKLLGDYPSNYTMYEYQVPGVKLGSEGSLCNINETLYYHSREGVFRYNGGSPELISGEFGLRRFQDAAAGAEGDRYYLSMQDVHSQEWGLWVYDTQRGLWLQEDESQGVDFAYHDGKLYFVTGTELVCVNPEESTEDFEWSATLRRVDETYHNRKSYSKLLLRMDIAAGSWLQVEVSVDDKPFELVYTDHDSVERMREIPILPKRCDNFRVRLKGSGPVVIRSMVREYSVGSTVR